MKDPMELKIGVSELARALGRSQGIAERTYYMPTNGTTGRYVFVNVGAAPVALATGDDLTSATCIVDDAEAGAGPVAAPSGFSGLTTSSVAVWPRTAVLFRQ